MKVLDIAFKDLTRSSRSLFLIGMTLVAPLVITVLIYFAFGSMLDGEVSMVPISVGVVNADTLDENAELEKPLGDNIREVFFDESVTSWITANDYLDEAAAYDAVTRQEIDVAVMIPSGFTSAVLAHESDSPVIILQDPTLTIAPNVVKDMIAAVLDGVAGGKIVYQVVSERMNANGVSQERSVIPALLERYSTWHREFQRSLFHDPQGAALIMSSPAASGQSTSAFQVMMGLVMAGQMIFFSAFTAANAMTTILQEDEEGTLARLFTTPTQRTVILSGKFLAVFLTVVLQGLALIGFGRLAFGIDWGEPASIVLAILGQMLALVGLGVLLISFVKTSKQVGPILGGALTGLGMVSGLFTTNIDMPATFDALGNFTPLGWVLKIWRLSLAGQPAQELLLPFFVLVAMGLVMFAIGALIFRKRYA